MIYSDTNIVSMKNNEKCLLGYLPAFLKDRLHAETGIVHDNINLAPYSQSMVDDCLDLF
jgi:hypothetical protein